MKSHISILLIFFLILGGCANEKKEVTEPHDAPDPLKVIESDPINKSIDVIRIAAVGAKTGDAAHSYRIFYPAMQYSIDKINREGGLLGKKIELLEFDNMSSVLGSKKAAIDAVEAGAIAVIGAFWSSHSMAMAPILQDAEVLMVSPNSTNPKVTLIGDYIFRVCYLDSFQGAAMSDFARNDLKAETSIIITMAGDLFSMGLGSYIKRAFWLLAAQSCGKEHIFPEQMILLILSKR
ncbi:MAG: ABC transporter substrate-binding protein [Spirochaetaceae bacterium]|nr:ABC transporter substrate-binding protein [Spirochaetaceae bacterium]